MHTITRYPVRKNILPLFLFFALLLSLVAPALLNPAFATDDASVTSAPTPAAEEPAEELVIEENTIEVAESEATLEEEQPAQHEESVAFTPSADSMAPAAEAWSSGGVTVQTAIAYDGTGHGDPATQCFINSVTAEDFGWTHVDDGPNDGVVCHQDGVGWRISFNVAASPTPTTLTLNVKDDFLNATGGVNDLRRTFVRQGDWTNWCTGASDGSYSASLSGSTCTFTFLPNQSHSGETFLHYMALTDASKAPISPIITGGVNGEALQPVPMDDVAIVSVTTDDLRILRESRLSGYTSINGINYYYQGYRAEAGHTYMDGWAKNKGVLTFEQASRSEFTTQIDLSAFPPGSLIESEIGDVEFPPRPIADGPFTIDRIHRSYTRNYFRVYVPVTDLPAGNYSYDLRLHNTDYHTWDSWYPGLFNQLSDQAGEDQERDWTTQGRFGMFVDYTGTSIRGQVYPNNDWSELYFEVRYPEGFYKVTKTDITSPYVSNPIAAMRPNWPYYSEVGTNPHPSVAPAGSLQLCDRWVADGKTVIDDAEREIVVTGRVAGEDAVRVLEPHEYTIEFGAGPNDRNACASTDPAVTDWTVSSSEANSVKITFNVDLDLMGQANFTIPFKTGPVEAFPNYPNQTRYPNWAHFSYLPNPEDPEAVRSWSPTNHSANVVVLGPYLMVPPRNEFTVTDQSTRTVVTSVVAGNDASVRYWRGSGDGFYGWQSIYPEDFEDLKVNYTAQATLSSCAVDVDLSQVWEARRTGSGLHPGTAPKDTDLADFMDAQDIRIVQEPDLGPDGLPCTDDDVSGWVMEWEGSFDHPGTAHGPRVYFDFSVPGYAPVGAEIDSSVTYVYTPENTDVAPQTNTATNSIAITANANAGQQKLRDTLRERVGSELGWDLVFYNNSETAIRDVEYLDVLPYVGDGRGTTATMSSVEIDSISVSDGSTIYVTSVDPSTIVRDTRDPMIDPSNPIWCEVDKTTYQPLDPTCLDGQITAVYAVIGVMPIGDVSSLHITVDSDGNQDGDKYVNNMAIANSPDLVLPIPAFRNLETVLWELYPLSGTVYADTNRNGDQDAGEEGVPNWVVTLTNDANEVVDTTSTDATGFYSFTELEPGTYVVTIADPATGQVITQSYTVVDPTGATTSPAQPATIVNEEVTDVDFGIFTPAAISGTVYNDDNASGSQDEGEAGVPGKTITLKDDEGNTVASTTTDENGYYEFTDLIPGTYVVEMTNDEGKVVTQIWEEVAPGGLPDADPVATTEPITAPPGSVVENVDFGLYTAVTLSGTVYDDYNRDGDQDTGEPGREGWTVTLTLPDNTTVTTVTDDNGYYEFTELRSGEYTVTIQDPATGEVLTQSYTVVDPSGTDTDISQPVTIVATDVTDVDFGIWTPLNISGYVYWDADYSTDRSEGEAGISEVTITLTGPDGSTQTTTTGADGYYEFTDLPPGVYEVKFTTPEGLIQTQMYEVKDANGVPPVNGESVSGDLTLVGEDITNVNFGFNVDPGPGGSDTPPTPVFESGL